MGYYMSTNPKMHYKAAYEPSWLLCPVRTRWVPYSDALPILQNGSSDCPLAWPLPLPSSSPSSSTSSLQSQPSPGGASQAMMLSPGGAVSRRVVASALASPLEQPLTLPSSSSTPAHKPNSKPTPKSNLNSELMAVDGALPPPLTDSEQAALVQEIRQGIGQMLIFTGQTIIPCKDLVRRYSKRIVSLLSLRLSNFIKVVGAELATKIVYVVER
eukprot:TRINITY_DN22823_c0_g1_i1.p1 TRINITY_DN22823_c0_g1~~TRINITY_DN22823_c0_g1_i1.p1  ORF type:complete len:250 (-),score=37.52 TRINITY_DN22823_c0_g1_i1:130-771(-)